MKIPSIREHGYDPKIHDHGVPFTVQRMQDVLDRQKALAEAARVAERITRMKKFLPSKHRAATAEFAQQVEKYGRHAWNLDLNAFGTTATRIPKIENRSIHLAQLNQITNYLLSLADEHGYLKFRKKYLWNRLDPECAEPLQFTTMTFYDLVDWVILPLTEAVKCSFVEVVAEEEVDQPPAWFVSHWMGASVTELIEACEHHAQVRALPADAGYWVCATALRPWEFSTADGLSKDLEAGLASAPSFARVLEAAQGVLAIVDREGRLFERAWCAAEVFAAKERNLPLDLAAVDPTTFTPQLLTDGLVKAEEQCEQKHQRDSFRRSGYLVKAKRESTFPVLSLKRGLEMTLDTCGATFDSEAGLVKSELTSTTGSSSAFDQQFRAVVALAAWRVAVAQGVGEDVLPLARTLQQDKDRTEVRLYLAHVEAFASPGLVGMDDLERVMRALPEQLTTFDLNLAGCKNVTTLDGLSGFAQPAPALTTLTLCFDGCSIASADGLAGLAAVPTLTALTVSLARSQLASLEAFEHLASLPALETLSLNLAFSPIASLEGLKHLQGLSQLTSLTLSFESNPVLASLEGLGSIPRTPRAVSLNFRDCDELSILDGLEVLSFMPALEAVVVDFQFSDKLLVAQRKVFRTMGDLVLAVPAMSRAEGLSRQNSGQQPSP